MIGALPRVRYREITLLAATILMVVTLGWIVGRDLRQSAETARQLYERLAQGLDLIDELQFTTQEVRRILLYALYTSDANVQLEYADQSRSADAHVQRLLDTSAALVASPAATRAELERVGRVWREYLLVRDEVIGLILEGSAREGVVLDQDRGLARFNEVREAISALKARLESDAAIQVSEASARAERATNRLLGLVVSALIAAALGVWLVNRRAALEALLRSEAHKGSILQAVPDPIISTNAEARIIELNEAAERTFGLTRRAALGRPIESVILPSHARGVLARVLSSAPAAATPISPRIETVGRRAHGAEFPMELTAVSHTAGRDRIWTLHLADVTARRQVEGDLRRAKDAAESADRAKSDFLATMSHELRTPLNGVIGIADLLQVADLTARQRDLVRMLRSSATALLGLVSDILDYSRIEAGLMDLKPVVCDLAGCIEDAFDPVTELASRKGLDLGYLIDPDVPPVLIADRDRVLQVLLNLLSNAVKFTDAGEVSVHVSAAPPSNGRREIRIRVRDTGIGIAPHLHARLFNRFAQLDASATRQYGGAGLGLAISARLSRLLGGSLTVDSDAGRGATFTFTFAAAEPPQCPETPVARFDGVRVLAHVAPGIVADQLGALLARWGARLTIAPVRPDAAPAIDVGAYDVMVIDADVASGAFQRFATRYDAGERAPYLAAIVVTRLGGGAPGTESALHAVGKPLRARALEDALRLAVGVPARPAQVAPPKPAVPRLAHDGLAILLVEDNAANRRVVQMMLEEIGLRADEADTGLEAVARARARAYDVILMDLQMPGLDGLEATRRIRAEEGPGRALIIALTANAMRGEERRCREAGMDSYLAKPLRLDTLAAALNACAASRA